MTFKLTEPPKVVKPLERDDVFVGGKKRPMVMEIIGEKGLKVGELKQKDKDELPYFILEESAC